MLGTTHTPYHGAGSIIGHYMRNPGDFCRRNTGNIFYHFRSIMRGNLNHLLITGDPGPDKLFILPAICDYSIDKSHNIRHISTWTNANVVSSLCCEFGKPRINYDNRCVIHLFCMEDMLHADGMCLSGV